MKKRAHTRTRQIFENMPFQCLFFNGFEIKTHGTKSVVAGYHRAVRIFHPPVIKVATAHCKLFDKLFHAIPCALAHSARHLSTFAHKNVSRLHVASMLDGVFVHRHKVCIFHFSHRSDFNVFHILTATIIPLAPPSVNAAVGQSYIVFFDNIKSLEKQQVPTVHGCQLIKKWRHHFEMSPFSWS